MFFFFVSYHSNIQQTATSLVPTGILFFAKCDKSWPFLKIRSAAIFSFSSNTELKNLRHVVLYLCWRNSRTDGEIDFPLVWLALILRYHSLLFPYTVSLLRKCHLKTRIWRSTENRWTCNISFAREWKCVREREGGGRERKRNMEIFCSYSVPRIDAVISAFR